MPKPLYILRSKRFGFLLDTLTEDKDSLSGSQDKGDIVSVIVKRHCHTDKPDAIGYAAGGAGRTILVSTLRETEHDVRQCALSLNIDFARIHKASIICCEAPVPAPA